MQKQNLMQQISETQTFFAAYPNAFQTCAKTFLLKVIYCLTLSIFNKQTKLNKFN